MSIVVDTRISLQSVRRGKPTVSGGWKAAVLGAVGRVRRTPPGSESGACLHRGNSGTWESHLSPCCIPGMGDRVTKGPGVDWALRPGHEPVWDTTNHGSRQGIGEASDTRSPREGQRAVVAAHSTGEGGEVRPKRPTGGKAPSGRASAPRRLSQKIYCPRKKEDEDG